MLFKREAFEIIDYQNNDSFPETLDRIFENVYKEIDNNVYASNKDLMTNSPYIKELIHTIRKRFNLNINIDPDLLIYNPAAIYFYYNIFSKDREVINELGVKDFLKFTLRLSEYDKFIKTINRLEKEKTEIIKKLHNKKGYINLKYARLEGYFKDLKCFLLLDPIVLKKEGITPRELTAIVLHEIGHAFNGLENHYKIEEMNLNIFNVINELNGNNIEKAEYVFKTKIATEEEFKNYLNTQRKRSDLLNYLVLSYLNKVNSQIYNEKYLETMSESQADEFATRFNRGKELVSGLNKIYSLYGGVLPNNAFVIYLVTFIELLLTGLLFMPLGSPGFIFGCILFLVLFYNLKLSNINMTYDFPLDRYNRIKNAIINNLKNINLDKRLTTYLIEQYTFIEEISALFVSSKSVLTVLSEYVSLDSREVKYYMDVQQKLENNLNNGLFVSSAKLRTFETTKSEERA